MDVLVAGPGAFPRRGLDASPLQRLLPPAPRSGCASRLEDADPEASVAELTWQPGLANPQTFVGRKGKGERKER